MVTRCSHLTLLEVVLFLPRVSALVLAPEIKIRQERRENSGPAVWTEIMLDLVWMALDGEAHNQDKGREAGRMTLSLWLCLISFSQQYSTVGQPMVAALVQPTMNPENWQWSHIMQIPGVLHEKPHPDRKPTLYLYESPALLKRIRNEEILWLTVYWDTLFGV